MLMHRIATLCFARELSKNRDRPYCLSIYDIFYHDFWNKARTIFLTYRKGGITKNGEWNGAFRIYHRTMVFNGCPDGHRSVLVSNMGRRWQIVQWKKRILYMWYPLFILSKTEADLSLSWACYTVFSMKDPKFALIFLWYLLTVNLFLWQKSICSKKAWIKDKFTVSINHRNLMKT